MSDSNYTFKQALDEVSKSSSGGAPFLIAYGTTFVITAFLSLIFPREASALMIMFQGVVALPLAFWLERRLSKSRISVDNPLTQLSMFLAVAQALAIPFLVVIYNINPGQIPVAMAGLGGVHFLPYAWLHRTRMYVIIGVAIAFGSFGLVLLLQTAAYVANLFLVGIVYLIAAPFVFQHARKLTDV